MQQVLRISALYFLLVAVHGCSTAYYETMEKLGFEKRDLLIDRVEDSRDAQGDASEQFADALEQFRATIAVDAGELEKTYDRLNNEYEKSVSRANEVRDRIEAVRDVSGDLFQEWEDELNEYSDAKIKRNSAAMLRDTQARYKSLIVTMERAEASMDPVLEAFQDQVLYLKHNLNSRAIGSLRGELAGIERDTKRLIEEMQRSIQEADAFVETLK